MNAFLTDIKQDLEIIEGESKSRLQIAMLSTRNQELLENQEYKLESFILHGPTIDIKNLKQFIEDFFEWDEEQKEVDAAYEQFLAENVTKKQPTDAKTPNEV